MPIIRGLHAYSTGLRVRLRQYLEPIIPLLRAYAEIRRFRSDLSLELWITDWFQLVHIN